jgi:hypothetical protein
MIHRSYLQHITEKGSYRATEKEEKTSHDVNDEIASQKCKKY